VAGGNLRCAGRTCLRPHTLSVVKTLHHVWRIAIVAGMWNRSSQELGGTMRDRGVSFKWYWLLDDVPATSITWLVAALSAWILFHIWPPLSLMAVLLVVVAHVVVQRRGARFLADLGPERPDPPKYAESFGGAFSGSK
jgi:hypothetical protein